GLNSPLLYGGADETRTRGLRRDRRNLQLSDVSNACQPVGISHIDAGSRVQGSQRVAPFSKSFVPILSPKNAPSGGRLESLRGGAENLLTVRQVADRLGLCTATVYKLCEQADLVHVWISNAIRVAPADLAAFVEQQRRGSPARAQPKPPAGRKDPDASPKTTVPQSKPPPGRPSPEAIRSEVPTRARMGWEFRRLDEVWVDTDE
ncbi:unnamed protein product, partial [marine sediment metagenome]